MSVGLWSSVWRRANTSSWWFSAAAQLSYRSELLNATAVVWIDENRPRYERRGQKLPGCNSAATLTNDERTVLEPRLRMVRGKRRPSRHRRREVMNGIRHIYRYGVPWGAMPKELPPGCDCHDSWQLLADDGHLERFNHGPVMADLEKAEREASPTLAIIDPRTVKCDAPQGEVGESVALPRTFDAARKVVSCRRHMTAGTDGRLLAVSVTGAAMQDQDGGIGLVHRLVRLCS